MTETSEAGSTSNPSICSRIGYGLKLALENSRGATDSSGRPLPRVKAIAFEFMSDADLRDLATAHPEEAQKAIELLGCRSDELAFCVWYVGNLPVSVLASE